LRAELGVGYFNGAAQLGSSDSHHEPESSRPWLEQEPLKMESYYLHVSLSEWFHEMRL